MNPDICRKCDTMNRSCCTLRAENNDGLPAPISPAEIQRIYDFFGSTPKILDSRINSGQFIQQMTLLFPHMADLIPEIFPPGERHMELKTIDDQCVLKNSDGCILPLAARPHFCSLYPFWFFDGEPQVFVDPNCCALEMCRTIPELLLSLGTTSERLAQIYSVLCKDWGLVRSISQPKMKVQC